MPKTEPEFYIFATLGLNQKLLKDLITSARNYKGAVVLRGLKEDSFIKTFEYLKQILGKENEGVLIDPTLFRKFEIRSVPAYVLSDGKDYDSIRGNVTAKFALSQIADKGQLKEEAKKVLSYAK